MDSTKMEVANRNRTFGSSLPEDAASSSSARATPSGVSVAAERASEEQTEGPAVQRLFFGTINDKDPCHDPNWTGHSNEAWKPDPEVVEAVFSSNGVMVGTTFCPYQAECRRSYGEPAKLLRVIEDDEIKFERPGRSDSGYRKNEHDDLKKKHEVFDKTVVLRQVFSDFKKTKEFEVMNSEIKEEVLKKLSLLSKRVTGKNEDFKTVVRKTFYTKILRTMFVQKVNMALKESFCDSAWRTRYFFPTFRNHGPEYQWWKQNFDSKTLEDRLDILREAAKEWDSKRDIFSVVELVTD